MEYRKTNVVERTFNQLFGLLVRLGIGLPHNFLLQVRGRRTGRVYSTPVNVLKHSGRRFLVAPRGDTQWSRNALASGEVTLVKGFRRSTVKVRPVCGRSEAGDSQGLSRSVHADGAAVLPGARRFAGRSVPSACRSVSGVRDFVAVTDHLSAIGSNFNRSASWLNRGR
jgi:deazaflavin-dependent oxidoreductase (nitroreductase family)